MSGAKCGMGMASFDDVSIGCNYRYHPIRVCLGLPDSVIDRDLTYNQKRELLRRREEARQLDTVTP